MKNPLTELREQLELSQRELAEILNVSQQFIQRHEKGMASTLPNRIGDYLDYRTTSVARLAVLGDLLVSADETGISWAVPISYRPGTGTWSNTSRNTVRLYDLWVRLSRASLPDVSWLLRSITFEPTICGHNAVVVQSAFIALRRAFGISGTSDESQQRYEIAAALCIHPFVLSNFLKKPDKLSGFPPAIKTAIQQTQPRILAKEDR